MVCESLIEKAVGGMGSGLVGLHIYSLGINDPGRSSPSRVSNVLRCQSFKNTD